MGTVPCRKCGNTKWVTGFISLGCPICGERVYAPVADDRLLWSEHRLGLMFRRDGWRFIEALEPPAWFLEGVI